MAHDHRLTSHGAYGTMTKEEINRLADMYPVLKLQRAATDEIDAFVFNDFGPRIGQAGIVFAALLTAAMNVAKSNHLEADPDINKILTAFMRELSGGNA